MLYLLGIGCSHPQTKIDNAFLEALGIDSSSAWIRDKIGIEERRTSLPLDYIKETKNADPREAHKLSTASTVDLGVAAARIALGRAAVKPSQIGLVICNCCNPTGLIPSEGQKIAANLGCDQALAHEVLTACPSFALLVDFINSFRPEELPEYVLCISTATLSQKVNYLDRSDSAIWGDGAAAWVLSAKQKGKLGVLDTFFSADPTRSHAVVTDTFGHFYQDGRAVRDFSVRQTVRLIKRLEAQFDIDWQRDIFIGHQANRTMLEQITNNRKIPDSNHWHNVTHLGNQAGAGAPAVLAQHWEQIKEGQKIVVAVLGAGLSWGSILFEAVAD